MLEIFEHFNAQFFYFLNLLLFYNLGSVFMPYKINSAIVKKDEKTGKYDLIDTEGKYGVEEILMVIDSDDLITMQLLINAILNNDFKAWKEINWEDGDNIKSLLIKLGYGRDDIIQMLKEI